MLVTVMSTSHLHFFLLLLSLCTIIRRTLADNVYAPYTSKCPASCHKTGSDPVLWTRLYRLEDLQSCDDGVVLFDFQIHNALSHDGFVTIRACTASAGQSFDPTPLTESNNNEGDSKPDNSVTVSNSCGADAKSVTVSARIGNLVTGSNFGRSTNGQFLEAVDVSLASDALAAYVTTAEPCGASILFAKSGDLVMGLFAGSEVTKASVSGLLKDFKNRDLSTSGASLQICGGTGTESETHTVGIYAANFNGIDSVQNAVVTWVDGECISSPKAQSASAFNSKIDILVSKYENSQDSSPSHKSYETQLSPLDPRGDCRSIQVHSGDSCPSLASKCKISGADFTKYNKNPKLCSTLQEYQWVCCSSGSLPDHRPKAGKDGVCYTYTIKKSDICYDIGKPWGLTASDIEGFNKKTWGFLGCGDLQTGQKICLSTGYPPMPATIPGATCGPQKPGTKNPGAGHSLGDLNPCPLNACCDVFGFCGTTAEFCTITKSPTGAPGTAKPKTSGCIQNCGTSIVNNSKPPSKFLKIGYYEAFSVQRTCLNMDVSSIDTSGFSHIHFAFATVNSKFQPDVSDYPNQFAAFTRLTGVKKILSFGGWAFSTDPATYQRFRQATDSSHRQGFVNSLVSFAKAHSIDGFDFDWEYPGAPDIPDITPGSSDEGKNYLDFLTLLKKSLPAGKSLSIAIPASFWYLQAYPVSKMAPILDYFVYMTYDLHGQWDVGNKWAIPSCSGGNCLRSHINKTETHNALVMVTKAGVSSTKLVIGVTSYGRGFRMTKSSCSGPMCTFQGGKNASPAWPGRCTNTSGYISNAELKELLDDPGQFSIKQSYDKDSDSDIIVYGRDNKYDWVAYMDGTTKSNRINYYKSLNFAGISDWAIDLEDFTGDTPGDEDSEPLLVEFDWEYVQLLDCDPKNNPGSLQKLADAMDYLPGICYDRYLVDILSSLIDDTIIEFQAVADSSYDKQFKYYADWVKDGINSQIQSFMAYGTGPGNKYFDCDWSYGHTKGSSSCAGMPHFWEQTFFSSDVTYHLKDEKGFYDELETKLGIQPDWVKFGDHEDAYECSEGSDLPIRTSADLPTRVGFSVCRKVFHHRHGYPQRVDGDQVHVGDPKKLIEASMGNITNLQTALTSSSISLGLHTYHTAEDTTYSSHDPAIAASMPTFQLMASVQNMREIKKIGQAAIDAERKNLILLIVGAVLLVIPFVGEELGPLVGSVTQVARIASIIGEAGNAAITVADIIQDPLSAPFAILGLLGGLGSAEKGVKAETGAYGKAAKARGALKAGDLAKFPTAFRDQDSLVQKIVKTCPRN